MLEDAERALNMADDLTQIVKKMMPQSHDLDLQRLLKQIDADLMDVKHKLAILVKLAAAGG